MCDDATGMCRRGGSPSDDSTGSSDMCVKTAGIFAAGSLTARAKIASLQICCPETRRVLAKSVKRAALAGEEGPPPISFARRVNVNDRITVQRPVSFTKQQHTAKHKRHTELHKPNGADGNASTLEAEKIIVPDQGTSIFSKLPQNRGKGDRVKSE